MSSVLWCIQDNDCFPTSYLYCWKFLILAVSGFITSFWCYFIYLLFPLLLHFLSGLLFFNLIFLFRFFIFHSAGMLSLLNFSLHVKMQRSLKMTIFSLPICYFPKMGQKKSYSSFFISVSTATRGLYPYWPWWECQFCLTHRLGAQFPRKVGVHAQAGLRLRFWNGKGFSPNVEWDGVAYRLLTFKDGWGVFEYDLYLVIPSRWRRQAVGDIFAQE